MKFYRQLILFFLIVLSWFAGFYAARWYYMKENKKEALLRAQYNIEFYHIISMYLDDRNLCEKLLSKFYQNQLKYLAKILGMPDDENHINPSLVLKTAYKDNYKTITIKAPSKLKTLHIDNPEKNRVQNDKKP